MTSAMSATTADAPAAGYRSESGSMADLVAAGDRLSSASSFDCFPKSMK